MVCVLKVVQTKPQKKHKHIIIKQNQKIDAAYKLEVLFQFIK